MGPGLESLNEIDFGDDLVADRGLNFYVLLHYSAVFLACM